MLHRLVREVLDLLDQPLLEPLGLLALQSRDHDVVDPVVLDRVLDRVVGVGAHRLPGRVDLVAVHLGQGRRQPGGDLLAADGAGARTDERVAVGPVGGALPQAFYEVLAVDGLSRDDEGVSEIPAHRVIVDPHRNVLDPVVPGLRPLDEVLARQAEAGLV